ncbi:PHD-finger domain-containing protein [Ditylenchus destructor]|uniref:PHD-finger domain-containing protein n=1 Tax=Ditylenchus destructor TaxID=166010 RepID=A0AAD4MI14_9BILA|nr:PHD-finger domain-containing protein [Ditylenchus destructor]
MIISFSDKGKPVDDKELYCACRQPYGRTQFYVLCASCEEWFHPECIGTMEALVKERNEFECPKCEESACLLNL